MDIICKNYEHYNRTLGKYIRSKQHYFNELAKGGYVTYEEGQKLVEKCKKEKEWKPSEKCIDVMRSIVDKRDRKGNIDLKQHPQIVNAMKEHGVKFDIPAWCPNRFKEKI